MPLPRIPAQALETAQQKLKDFRTKRLKVEWKAFEIVNADEDTMKSIESAHKFEVKLLSIMETKTRLPCVVCQPHRDVIYCSITYTSTLTSKERISHSQFKPTVYCVIFPNESVFYSTRGNIPDVIKDTFLLMYGATRLNKLPLEGRDFRSLRQLHYNKAHKGMVCRRPVKDTHPLNVIDIDMNEISAAASSGEKDDGIQDEDQPWKKRKDEYYRQHFYPEKDPTISKFTVSSSSKFSGTRTSKDLDCDLKVTFRSDNLINFINYSMDKGILSYPLNPFLENVVNLGRTSISISSQGN